MIKTSPAALLATLCLAMPSSADAQVRKVPEALMTATAGGGQERVIVELASPAQGGRQEAFRQPERYITDILRDTARGVSAIGDAPLVVVEVSSAGLRRLESDPSVARVLPDRLMQAFLPESTKLLHLPEVWSTTKGDGLAVAILDTGVARHPFVARHIVAEACFSSTAPAQHSRSLCPNGQAEQTGEGAGDACDYRAVATNCVHGTHVAGIAAGAAGRSKTGPLDGVAPQAKIVAVQVFSRFEGETVCGKGVKACINAWTSDVIKGLLFVERTARQTKIAAVNLSLGGGKMEATCDLQSPYADIVKRLTQEGIAVVAAAGNNAYVGAVSEPACISAAITVGATRKDGTIDVSYSNTSDKIDVVAPGTQILSAAADGYYKLDGTSMAAPHITGLIALLKARHPEASVADMLKALKESGTKETDPRNKLSFMLPDAHRAMAALDGAGQPAQPAPAPVAPQPQRPAPDPRISSCGPVCVEIDRGTRRVIFVLADRNPVSRETLASLRTLLGAGAKVEDIGDGKLVVELPEGASGGDVDRARRGVGDGTRMFPDTPLQTLQPGQRIQIR